MTARGLAGSASILREENAKLMNQVRELSNRLTRAEEVILAHTEKERAMRSSVMLLRREVSLALSMRLNQFILSSINY